MFEDHCYLFVILSKTCVLFIVFLFRSVFIICIFEYRKGNCSGRFRRIKHCQIQTCGQSELVPRAINSVTSRKCSNAHCCAIVYNNSTSNFIVLAGYSKIINKIYELMFGCSKKTKTCGFKSFTVT